MERTDRDHRALHRGLGPIPLKKRQEAEEVIGRDPLQGKTLGTAPPFVQPQIPPVRSNGIG